MLRDRANAQDVNASLAQQQTIGMQQLLTMIPQPAAPTTVVVQQAAPAPPPGPTTVNVDNRCVAVLDNRSILQKAIDGRTSLILRYWTTVKPASRRSTPNTPSKLARTPGNSKLQSKMLLTFCLQICMEEAVAVVVAVAEVPEAVGQATVVQMEAAVEDS